MCLLSRMGRTHTLFSCYQRFLDDNMYVFIYWLRVSKESQSCFTLFATSMVLAEKFILKSCFFYVSLSIKSYFIYFFNSYPFWNMFWNYIKLNFCFIFLYFCSHWYVLVPCVEVLLHPIHLIDLEERIQFSPPLSFLLWDGFWLQPHKILQCFSLADWFAVLARGYHPYVFR